MGVREARAREREQRRVRLRGRGDDGAALVEFAFVAPILFLVIFGIIEFGWAFFQNLDVRHGAREGARLVAVNYQEDADPSATGFQAPTPADQLTQLVAETCDRMDSGAGILVNLRRPGGNGVGEKAVVTIRKPLNQLTGGLAFALNGVTLNSAVDIRLEQTATWTSMAAPDPNDPLTYRACT